MIKKQGVEKKRFWQRTIGEAARSGVSIREFCRQHRLKESQFYWWQRKLKAGRQERTLRRQGINRGATSFALVTEEPGATDTGIELVLDDKRRLRISKGVDEETLRAVLAAVESSRC
jgi:transposase-like protein